MVNKSRITQGVRLFILLFLACFSYSQILKCETTLRSTFGDVKFMRQIDTQLNGIKGYLVISATKEIRRMSQSISMGRPARFSRFPNYSQDDKLTLKLQGADLPTLDSVIYYRGMLFIKSGFNMSVQTWTDGLKTNKISYFAFFDFT